MKNPYIKILAAFTVVCGLASAAAQNVVSYSSGTDGSVSVEVARYANDNGINKLVMLEFYATGGAEQGEADYIAGKIAADLADYKNPALIERSFFERALSEARAASAAGISMERVKKLRDLISVDAALTGTVFAVEGKLKVLARLIDLKTGKVIFVTESESARQEPTSYAARVAGRRGGIYYLTPELPGILVPDGIFEWAASAPSSAPGGFRDAISDSHYVSSTAADKFCADRRSRLARLNSALVDTKARYWADKMKEPGFRGLGLRENPGSEIDDPRIKSAFYTLLARYYKTPPAALPGSSKFAEVIRLIEEERLFTDDCEMH